eukprot:TRINITY_DN9967_c1_g5_i1.p1 TRINITY_DN9967_c1_g5~~TRINITY_DN9967_c1_g5_i1.p1  ORF type:complete len:820 (-),score=130.01 TRINITY_DN9967_c1_g5_i1:4-2463(-)
MSEVTAARAQPAHISTASARDPSSWLWAVRAFHDRWFPHPSKIQHFWFGARRPALRAFFVSLVADFESPLAFAAESCRMPAAGFDANAAGVFRGLAFAGRPISCALARLRLRTAIFLDQMARNIESLRGPRAQGVAELKAACDAAAVPLALAAIADTMGTACAANVRPDILALGTPAEICFLTLVLRHSRQEPFIALATWVLNYLASALPATDSSATDLCKRFMEETEDAFAAISVEAYLARAIISDEPQQMPAFLASEPLPRLEVLDARCQERADVAKAVAGGEPPPFLRPLLSTSDWDDHSLVNTLQMTLGELGMLTRHKGLVLSLSGGVDSMVTCCLLWLVQRRLPPSQRFQWCAMHLCHPNRDDALDEEGWVRWSCGQLGVNVWSYRPQIRRPHGKIRTGISRERYEEKSKELRFRMYARCLARLGVSADDGAALVVHHQDDADENRLAELGKGNLLHIDGMAMRGTTLGVEVLRPLLFVRKSELIAFAEAASVCYMRDSTPKWSRRGWTRRTLDSICAEDAEKSSRLLVAMKRAGATSQTFASVLESSLSAWKSSGVLAATLSVVAPTSGGEVWRLGSRATGVGPVSKGKNKPKDVQNDQVIAPAIADLVDVAVLRLPGILALVGDPFDSQLASLRCNVAEVAEIWNAAIDKAKDADGIAHSNEAEVGTRGAEHDGLCAEDAADDAPGLCPLQRITVHEAEMQVGTLLLTAAVYSVTGEGRVRDLLRGQPVAKKALAHIWDCIVRARREFHWGSLHKRCPCVYLREQQCLVLVDAEGRDGKIVDKRWQCALAEAAFLFVQTHDQAALKASSTLV